MRDDYLTALPLPSAATTDPDVRGGPSDQDVAELRRRFDAHQLSQPPAANAAFAAKRRQLITAIHALDRAKPNVAIDGIIRGAVGGTVAQLLIHGVRLWFESRPKRVASEPSAARPLAPTCEERAHDERDIASTQSTQNTGGKP